MIRRFDLENEGLTRVLGELEAQIMETIWRLGRATVKEVEAALGPDAHHKTVMTVMNRMVAKNLLTREADGRRFVYSAVLDRHAFRAEVAEKVLSGLLSDFGRPAMAHFVSEATPEQLAELERLIAERRARGCEER